MASPIYTKTWSASFPQNIFLCTFYLIYFLKSVLYTHVGIAFLRVASDIFLHSDTHRYTHTHKHIHTQTYIHTLANPNQHETHYMFSIYLQPKSQQQV